MLRFDGNLPRGAGNLLRQGHFQLVVDVNPYRSQRFRKGKGRCQELAQRRQRGDRVQIATVENKRRPLGRGVVAIPGIKDIQRLLQIRRHRSHPGPQGIALPNEFEHLARTDHHGLLGHGEHGVGTHAKGAHFRRIRIPFRNLAQAGPILLPEGHAIVAVQCLGYQRTLAGLAAGVGRSSNTTAATLSNRYTSNCCRRRAILGCMRIRRRGCESNLGLLGTGIVGILQQLAIHCVRRGISCQDWSCRIVALVR